MAISHTKMHTSLEVTISGGEKLPPPRKPWEINLRPFVEKGQVTSVGFLGGSALKNLWANAGDVGSIPRSGRPPGEGNGNPLQYSCLGNPMDRGAWQATVHEVVVKSQIRLGDSLPTTSDQCTTSIWKWRDIMNTNNRAFLLPLLTWSHCWGTELGRGGNQDQAPHLPANSLTTWELQAEASPARPRMVDAIISQPFEVSARNICCHYHVWLGQQHPPEEDRTLCPPPSLRHCQRAGSRERGASPSWSNFTCWFFSINKLVTFAPHLAGKVSNNTLIPSENMNHWHAGGSGYLPPLSAAKDPTH